MTTAILILAAGSSTRMGKAKLLLLIGKKTLLENAIENAVQSNANQVFCVLGKHAEELQESIRKYDIISIYNPNFENGLSSSIVEGIKQIQQDSYDSVLIMLADQPNIDTLYLNALIESFQNAPSKITASNYSGVCGVPAIFPKHTFSQLLKLKGDKGAKELLNSHMEDVISIKSDKLIDIDTQDDYLNFLKSK